MSETMATTKIVLSPCDVAFVREDGSRVPIGAIVQIAGSVSAEGVGRQTIQTHDLDAAQGLQTGMVGCLTMGFRGGTAGELPRWSNGPLRIEGPPLIDAGPMQRATAIIRLVDVGAARESEWSAIYRVVDRDGDEVGRGIAIVTAATEQDAAREVESWIDANDERVTADVWRRYSIASLVRHPDKR